MTNLNTNTLVSSVLRLVTQEEKTRGEAVQTLVYLLVTAHAEGTLPEGFDILQAYKAQGRDAQKTRNNLLLTHLFKVMVLENTDKGPVYRKRDDVSDNVLSLLKTRINRTLIVAAWIVSQQALYPKSEIVKHNNNGLLSVKGNLYFSAKELQDTPALVENWTVLDGRKSAASGKYDILAKRAAQGLDFKREARARPDADAIAAKLTITQLMQATEGKANLSQSVDKAVSKAELEAMKAAWIALGNAIKHAEAHALPIKPTTPVGEQVANIKQQARQQGNKHTAALKAAANK